MSEGGIANAAHKAHREDIKAFLDFWVHSQKRKKDANAPKKPVAGRCSWDSVGRASLLGLDAAGVAPVGQASLLGLGGAGVAPGTRWGGRRSGRAAGGGDPGS